MCNKSRRTRVWTILIPLRKFIEGSGGDHGLSERNDLKRGRKISRK